MSRELGPQYPFRTLMCNGKDCKYFLTNSGRSILSESDDSSFVSVILLHVLEKSEDK